MTPPSHLRLQKKVFKEKKKTPVLSVLIQYFVYSNSILIRDGIVKVLTVLLLLSIRYFNGILICTFLYLYIYAHTHTHTYTHAHTHTHIYTHIHTHTYIYIHTHIYIYIHTHTHIFTYIYIYIHIYIYIYIYIYIHVWNIYLYDRLAAQLTLLYILKC